MGRIVVTEFVSLDGVVEDPGGSEDFKYGGWSFEYSRGEEGDEFKLDETRSTRGAAAGPRDLRGLRRRLAVARGRVRRPVQLDAEVRRLHDAEGPEWTNTTVLDGDLVRGGAPAQREIDGDVVVHGSAQLAQALIENELVDELRLMVFPVILGTGKRLFGDPGREEGAAARRLEGRRRRRPDPDVRGRAAGLTRPGAVRTTASARGA